MMNKRKILIVISIFSIAFIVRLINLETIKSNPIFEHPTMDEKYHDEWAREIASGDLFGRTPFYRAPLYPYLLGFVYSVFGHNYYLARLINIIIGAISCVFIYLLGRELFSDRVAVLSGFLGCFYSMFIFFDSMLLTVSLEVLLSLLSIYLLICWMRSKSGLLIFLSGLILGLASITRPNFLVFFPLVVIFLIAKFKKDAFKIRYISAGLFSAGVIIPVIIITMINSTIGGDRVLIAWNGGINFYLGNNSNANGWSPTAPGIDPTWWGGYRDAIIIAEQDVGKEMLSSQVSDYWYNQGLIFITTKPIMWLRLMIKKCYSLLNSGELNNNVSIQTLATLSYLLRLPILNFGLIVSLTLFLLVFLKKDKGTNLLIMYISVYSVTIVLFFVTARYRMPLVPFLLILSSVAIFKIIDNIKKKNSMFYLKLPFIPFVIFFVNTDLYNINKMHQIKYDWLYGSYGNLNFDSGKYFKALEFYKMAIKYNPQNIDAINGIGNSYLALGKNDLAIEKYKTSLRLKPNVDASSKLGLLYLKLGQMDSAQFFLKEALNMNPISPEIQYYFGMYYAYSNDRPSAIKHLESALKFYPNPIYLRNIYYNLAKLYLEAGDTLKANRYISKLKSDVLGHGHLE